MNEEELEGENVLGDAESETESTINESADQATKEDENITLNTEGDDENNTTPIDSEEMGKNYKSIIENLMQENKKLRKKNLLYLKANKSIKKNHKIFFTKF